MTTKKLPEQFRYLFWDTRFEDVDVQRHARAIIVKMLTFPNSETIHWLLTTYDKALIIDVLETSKALRPSMFFAPEKRKMLEDFFYNDIRDNTITEEQLRAVIDKRFSLPDRKE